MRIAAISEFKTQISKFLKLVKLGEKIEIHERGRPIAIVSSYDASERLKITPASRDSKALVKIRFSSRLDSDIDVVAILEQDRKRR